MHYKPITMPKIAKPRAAAAAASAVAATNKAGRAAGAAAVARAVDRGVAILNNGAGTMPVDAPAPHGGTRYTLLTDPPDAALPHWLDPHSGLRDDGTYIFTDEPDFRPTFSPRECLQRGVFGGCYFNSHGGKRGIFGREVAVDHAEFPPLWFDELDESKYRSRRYNVPTNLYGVKSGQDQAFWEMKGWIHAQDPRGWFQWYCRFFMGRRSHDDSRQIARWAACAGFKGRWRNQLCGKVRTARKSFDDASVSPVIRQTLLHWAYELSEDDFQRWRETH